MKLLKVRIGPLLFLWNKVNFNYEIGQGYNFYVQGLSVIGVGHAAFVDTALEAMRDSDFLSKSDQRIIADQARLVESGVTFNPERQAVFIESNGECDSSFPTFDGKFDSPKYFTA